MGHNGIRNFKRLMQKARFGIVLIKEIQDISILQLIVLKKQYYVKKVKSFNVENNFSCFSCSMDTTREKSQYMSDLFRAICNLNICVRKTYPSLSRDTPWCCISGSDVACLPWDSPLILSHFLSHNISLYVSGYHFHKQLNTEKKRKQNIGVVQFLLNSLYMYPYRYSLRPYEQLFG